MGDFYHEHGTPSFDFGRHFGFYFDTNHKPTFALDAFYKIYSYKTHKPQNPAESGVFMNPAQAKVGGAPYAHHPVTLSPCHTHLPVSTIILAC